MREKLKKLYQELSEMTNPVCATKCFLPRTCCSPEYCDYAIAYARKHWQEELKPTGHPSLPLMGPMGCTAPPHTRPMCTAHVCERTLMQLGKKFWDAYWKLRSSISKLEWRLFPPNEEEKPMGKAPDTDMEKYGEEKPVSPTEEGGSPVATTPSIEERAEAVVQEKADEVTKALAPNEGVLTDEEPARMKQNTTPTTTTESSGEAS